MWCVMELRKKRYTYVDHIDSLSKGIPSISSFSSSQDGDGIVVSFSGYHGLLLIGF